MLPRYSILALALLTAIVPQGTSALTLVQALGFFHVAVGLLLAITVMTFIVGLGIYFARLNTWPSHRDHAIIVLEWSVVMLFVLLVLVAIVNFFQKKPEIALPILAFIVVVTVAILIVRYAATRGGGKEEKH